MTASLRGCARPRRRCFVGCSRCCSAARASWATERTASGAHARRLSIYTLTGRRRRRRSPRAHASTARNVARSAVELAGRVVAAAATLEERLARRLEAAGVPLQAAEWCSSHIGIARRLGGSSCCCSPAAASLADARRPRRRGGRARGSYLDATGRRDAAAFLAQLPDTLQLLAGSLSAGYSLPQAIDTVVREGHAADRRRVQPGTGRDPARRADRGRAGRRRRRG